MSGLELSDEELELRRPVWGALSELFVGADVGLDDDSVARSLAASPYHLLELDSILTDEVYPVCVGSGAGQRAGFDVGWLEAQILTDAGRPRLSSPLFRPRRILTSDRWLNIKRLVNRFRLLGEED